MSNLWSQFRALLPQDPLLVGQVIAHNSDGTSSITLPGNVTIRAIGQSVAVGLWAFVQSGTVQTEAPSLPSYVVTV
jgi:hypothetical protein